MKTHNVYGKPAEFFTYEKRDGHYVVHAWGTYPECSVLAGQPCKQFVDAFETAEAAIAAWPEAEPSHWMLQQHNTFDHLPDGPDWGDPDW